MSDAAAMEKQLWSVTFLDREVAATRLAEAGEHGVRVLTKIATDGSVPREVRVTALRHLPAAEGIAEALALLLVDAQPVIRALALEKAADAHATTLTARVEELTRDAATFWDLDEEISIAAVATRTLAALRGAP